MAKYIIRPTKRFKKDLRKIARRVLDVAELYAVIEQLADGKELAPKYRNHQLSGGWKNRYECHIRPDWLLIYYKDNKVLVLTLTRNGTHSDLF